MNKIFKGYNYVRKALKTSKLTDGIH